MGTGEQVPSSPATLHELQGVPHVLLQQYLSTQFPAVHWLAAVQAEPWARCLHNPPMQLYPLLASQSASDLHPVALVPHALVLATHRYPAWLHFSVTRLHVEEVDV
jgi:hypothetical protein